MTVLLAYVASPEGDAALAVAVEEARRRATRALVVHVLQPEAAGAPYSEEQTLDAVRQRFADAGVEVEVRELPPGTDVADAVIAAAEEADLAVIGLRRRTAVGKLVLGSTAQRLLLELDCLVLAVKVPR